VAHERLPILPGEPQPLIVHEKSTLAFRRGGAFCARPARYVSSSSSFLPTGSPRLIPTRRYVLLAACLTLALTFTGCWKKRLSANEIHAVTEEFVAAARDVIGKQTKIDVTPETETLPGGTTYFAGDQIYILLEDSSKQAALETALDAVARRNHLTRGSLSKSSNAIRFDYSRGDQRTHAIHLLAPPAAAMPAPNASALPKGAPRLAIIIDDLGHDLPPLQEILQLHYPLTLSVIPNLPDSAEAANEAHAHSDEVLLHLPMQAIEADAKTEPVELRVGMNSNQVDKILSAMLETVPHAAGVNNHQGSRATADPALMNELMEALQRRGLFFVDSRTTKETVAFDTAEKKGVRAAFRNAQFLDDTPTAAAILAQLNRAESDARRKGWAVTIGHPHAATIQVLREQLPKIEGKGIKLVFVSEVVK
jgi:polysaccharide deacetylase 2 family uncharacterized protein YibQ